MADRALALIRSTRAALAAAQVAWGAAGWTAVAAPAAAAAIFILRQSGIISIETGIVLWAALVLAAMAVGALRAFRRRIDMASAALWLDRSLDDGELLSAALVCLERPRSGRFDAAVLVRAEALAESAARPRPKAGPLALRAILAAAACLASFLFVSQTPVWAKAVRNEARSAGGGAAAARGGSAAIGADARPAPRAVARSLFPNDAGLADLAEQALREGRLDDFDDIVAKADAQLVLRHAESGSREVKNRLEAERERLKAAARAAAEGFSPEKSAREAAREGGGESESEDPGSSQEDDGSADERGGQDPEQPQGQGGEESPPGDPEGTAPRRGGGRGGSELDSPNADSQGRSHPGDTRPGTGAGRSRSWGPIEGAAGGPEAPLPDDPRAALFNYLMPGDDPSATLSERVEAAGRSAEAAVARESLPWEYSDFLKSYFLALSKAAAEVDLAREAEGAQR